MGLLSSITIWSIWKARFLKEFENKNLPILEFVKDIWLKIIHMLTGQYHNIIGTSKEAKEGEGSSMNNGNDIPSIIYLICDPSGVMLP